jgi:hypothetical protein
VGRELPGVIVAKDKSWQILLVPKCGSGSLANAAPAMDADVLPGAHHYLTTAKPFGGCGYLPSDAVIEPGPRTAAFIREPVTWWASWWSYRSANLWRAHSWAMDVCRTDIGTAPALGQLLEWVGWGPGAGMLGAMYTQYLGPGGSLVDFVGRTERLESDLERFLGRPVALGAVHRAPTPINADTVDHWRPAVNEAEGLAYHLWSLALDWEGA